MTHKGGLRMLMKHIYTLTNTQTHQYKNTTYTYTHTTHKHCTFHHTYDAVGSERRASRKISVGGQSTRSNRKKQTNKQKDRKAALRKCSQHLLSGPSYHEQMYKYYLYVVPDWQISIMSISVWW